jgi:hypothetical protein
LLLLLLVLIDTWIINRCMRLNSVRILSALLILVSCFKRIGFVV